MDDVCTTRHQPPERPGLGAHHDRLLRGEQDGHAGERCGGDGDGAGHGPGLDLAVVALLDGHDAHGERLVLSEQGGCRL